MTTKDAKLEDLLDVLPGRILLMRPSIRVLIDKLPNSTTDGVGDLEAGSDVHVGAEQILEDVDSPSAATTCPFIGTAGLAADDLDHGGPEPVWQRRC